MIDVILRPELLKNEPLNALGGPQLRGVTGVLGAASQKFDEIPPLTIRQLRGTPRTWLAPKSDLPLLLRLLQPLADSSSTDTKLAGDVRLGNTLPIQSQGVKATVFKRDGISSLSHGETISRTTDNVNLIMRQSVAIRWAAWTAPLLHQRAGRTLLQGPINCGGVRGAAVG